MLKAFSNLSHRLLLLIRTSITPELFVAIRLNPCFAFPKWGVRIRIVKSGTHGHFFSERSRGDHRFNYGVVLSGDLRRYPAAVLKEKIYIR